MWQNLKRLTLLLIFSCGIAFPAAAAPLDMEAGKVWEIIKKLTCDINNLGELSEAELKFVIEKSLEDSVSRKAAAAYALIFTSNKTLAVKTLTRLRKTAGYNVAGTVNFALLLRETLPLSKTARLQELKDRLRQAQNYTEALWLVNWLGREYGSTVASFFRERIAAKCIGEDIFAKSSYEWVVTEYAYFLKQFGGKDNIAIANEKVYQFQREQPETIATILMMITPNRLSFVFYQVPPIAAPESTTTTVATVLTVTVIFAGAWMIYKRRRAASRQ